MRAAVYHGKHDIRLEDIPEPVPGPGEVAVRVAHNGLCGSDLHEYQSGPLSVPTSPHPLTGAVLPVVLGHEFAGTVSALGSDVTTVAEGDRVCVEPIYRCDECPGCQAGSYNLCRSLAFHGLMARGGGLSEVTVVPERTVHRLPGTVSLELGALVEPMAVAMHAVRRGLRGMDADGTAVVFGAGPIGIGLWYALRARGVADIVLVEPSAERRAAITGLGATGVIDPDQRDPVAYVRSRTGGRGAAVAFDAAGAPATIAGGLRCLSVHGRLISVAVYGRGMPVEPDVLLRYEVTWTGSLAYTAEDFRAVIDLMREGHYTTRGWVRHIGMDAVVTDGFGAMTGARAVKVLVDIAQG